MPPLRGRLTIGTSSCPVRALVQWLIFPHRWVFERRHKSTHGERYGRGIGRSMGYDNRAHHHGRTMVARVFDAAGAFHCVYSLVKKCYGFATQVARVPLHVSHHPPHVLLRALFVEAGQESGQRYLNTFLFDCSFEYSPSLVRH